MTSAVLGLAYVVFRAPAAESLGPPAHADHLPKHGGRFFMAANGFHHVEGTLQDGEFRLYLYDNHTRPVDARPFRARAGDRVLSPHRGGEYLALGLNDIADSRRITAFIRFRQDQPEERFDFVFPTEDPQ